MNATGYVTYKRQTEAKWLQRKWKLSEGRREARGETTFPRPAFADSAQRAVIAFSFNDTYLYIMSMMQKPPFVYSLCTVLLRAKYFDDVL